MRWTMWFFKRRRKKAISCGFVENGRSIDANCTTENSNPQAAEIARQTGRNHSRERFANFLFDSFDSVKKYVHQLCFSERFSVLSDFTDKKFQIRAASFSDFYMNYSWRRVTDNRCGEKIRVFCNDCEIFRFSIIQISRRPFVINPIDNSNSSVAGIIFEGRFASIKYFSYVDRS